MKFKELLIDKKLNNNEQKFIEFIDSNGNYPFKNDSFKFMFVNCKIDKDIILSLFDGLLKNILVFETKGYFIIIYHDKERIHFENYIETFSEDIGQMISVFEGFNIKINRKNYLLEFIEIFNTYFQDFHHSFLTISDIILTLNNNRRIIESIRTMLLERLMDDNQFEKLVVTLFKNNLNISKTANDMYMHRNTINNKLNNLENETNLSIQKFRDAIAIYELMKK